MYFYLYWIMAAINKLNILPWFQCAYGPLPLPNIVFEFSSALSSSDGDGTTPGGWLFQCYRCKMVFYNFLLTRKILTTRYVNIINLWTNSKSKHEKKLDSISPRKCAFSPLPCRSQAKTGKIKKENDQCGGRFSYKTWNHKPYNAYHRKGKKYKPKPCLQGQFQNTMIYNGNSFAVYTIIQVQKIYKEWIIF